MQGAQALMQGCKLPRRESQPWPESSTDDAAGDDPEVENVHILAEDDPEDENIHILAKQKDNT